MKFNVSEHIKKAEQEYGLGKGEYLRIEDGPNKLRLLSVPVPHESVYKGTKTFKFVAWVIDRVDGVIKPYFMPITVLRAIEALQNDPDYAFDELPMPYDITINAKNARTKDVEYTVVAARQNTPLTAEEQKALSDKIGIEEFVEKLKDRDNNQQAPAPKEAAQPSEEDDLPPDFLA